MLKLKVLQAAVNRVRLGVDLAGRPGARIYRSRRAAGPYEEVGVAFEETYDDTAHLEPGKTCYYLAAEWRAPSLIPETNSLKGADPLRVAVPRAQKERSSVLTEKREEFTISMGGNLDESNTVTVGPEVYCPGPNSSMPPYDQVFEPNQYVVIENLGETDVENPWVVANGRRDWWSAETMMNEIAGIAGGGRLDDRDKMMAIWKFVVDELYDSRIGLSWFDRTSDPVRLFNVYGFEGCVANAITSRRLAEAMGVKSREIWLGGTIDGYGRGRSCGHDIFEAFADGDWHFLDTDLMVFFLKRDNRTVAGAEDLSRDIDLLRRSHRNLGLCGRDLPEKDYYYTPFRERQYVYPPNKGGAWMDAGGKMRQTPGEFPPAQTMALRLRPGEKLVRYWDNVGKNVIRGKRLYPTVRYSNGKLAYRPDLRGPLGLKGTESAINVAQETSGRRVALHPEKKGEVSEVVWRVASPYAIAGARLGIRCRCDTQEDGLEVLFSKDGEDWRSLWVAIGRRLDACVDLDWYLNPALNDWRGETDLGWRMGPCYQYYIKVAMWAGSRPHAVGLDAIRFDTDIQCATRSLPSLFCGDNTIAYRDDTPGQRKVRVTYGWREERSIRPPGAPGLIYPDDGADVDRLDFEFRWKRPRGGSGKVDDYHVQVSRYADFRWCVCPAFDRYVGRTAYAGGTKWQAEFPNLLNPDDVYFWRVRARNDKGVWGEWSETRSFTPHGPRLPVDLRVEGRGGKRSLVWSANENGNPAVRYLVHGCPESGGFSATDENLLCTVDEARWPLDDAVKGTSFRVVAVDAGGVPSTPSEYVTV